MGESSERPVSASGAKLFKIAFDLDSEGAKWPPVSVERLWGEKTSVRLEIRVVNTPFFVRGISFGDLIQVRPDNDRRELVFERFKQESGHSTVRIIFLEQGERSVIESSIRDAGCSWEFAHGFPNYIAVDIPPVVEYGNLRDWLVGKVSSGEIEIQESAISTLHQGQVSNFP